MKIVESYQDIENYLRNAELIDKLIERFGEDFYSQNRYGELIDFIDDIIEEQFGARVDGERVVICKVVDEDIDLIDTDHYVVVYNGYYYDYTAMQFSDQFENLSPASIPVVQKVIKSDDQIIETLSTVKGYIILGY